MLDFIIRFISTLYILPLILRRDIFNVNGLTLILKIIGQCDVKHIMTLVIKTIASVLKVRSYIIISITASPNAIMSVSTFTTDVILYKIQYHKYYMMR